MNWTEAASEKRFSSDQTTSRTLVADQVSDCEADKDCFSLNNDCPETNKITDPHTAQNDLGKLGFTVYIIQW